MSSQNKICLLGSSISQYPLAKFLKLRKITFDYISSYPSHPFDRAGGTFIKCDLKNTEKAIRFCRSGGYERVLSMGSDICCRLLSLLSDKKIISEKFIVPVELYDTFFDKKTFQSDFDHSNPIKNLIISLNGPWPEELQNFLNTNGNCIVKPVDAYASKGVSSISSNEDFISITRKSFQKSPSKTLLVQKTIVKDGLQICGDGYIENSKIKFLKLGFNKSYNSGFIPLLEAFPSFEIECTEDIKIELTSVIKNAGIKNSFFNVDIIISDGKIHVLEIALRLGGNCISDAIFYSTGKNLLDIYFCGHLKKIAHTPMHCINFMLHSKKGGFFDKKMISQFSGFKELNCFLQNSDILEPVMNNSKTFGNLVYVFSNYKKFSDALEIGTELGNINK